MYLKVCIFRQGVVRFCVPCFALSCFALLACVPWPLLGVDRDRHLFGKDPEEACY